jgi:hypothetical protein
MTVPVSQIDGDVTAIIAVWGPLGKDLAYKFFVRGVEIQRMDITKHNDRGQMFRLCRFPDGRDMWVNEGNIASKRIARFAGQIGV